MNEWGSVRVAFETARLRLAEIRNEGQQARLRAFSAACEQSARTLQVERVSIWFLSDDEQSITRALQYTLSTHTFEHGGEIQRANCDRYFEALHCRRVVVAHDAIHDPRTSQLGAYLMQYNVFSLLDAPIFRDGRVIGVVCHEHVGSLREWTEREAGFASAVADLLTILIHQAERAELRAAIDHQREIEAQNAKMQALVRLARVVVHDLANVMTVASIRAEEIEREQPDTEDIVQVLAYGTRLLDQLRAFCDQRESKGSVDAALQVRSLSSTLASLLGKNVQFRLECDVSGVEVDIAPIELEQLVVNLCMNAKDAIGERGQVSLKLTRTGDTLQLEVRDDGCGMDEATQARVFEPFYSTKAGHSGVGLSAVYGIVERARGSIEIESTLGGGTTFRIALPLARRASDVEPPWSF